MVLKIRQMPLVLFIQEINYTHFCVQIDGLCDVFFNLSDLKSKAKIKTVLEKFQNKKRYPFS